MSTPPVTLPALVDQIRAASTGNQLDDITAAIEAAAALSQVGEDLVHYFVEVARAADRSWGQIGTAMGVTRQAAQQRHVSRASTARVTFDDEGVRMKAAPFSGVRVSASGAVEVQVENGGAWSVLVELDGRPISEVLAVARTYGKRWLKRLSEDLDEIYQLLGDTLGDTAEVVLADALGRRVRRSLDVTVAKRKAAWTLNNA